MRCGGSNAAEGARSANVSKHGFCWPPDRWARADRLSVGNRIQLGLRPDAFRAQRRARFGRADPLPVLFAHLQGKALLLAGAPTELRPDRRPPPHTPLLFALLQPPRPNHLLTPPPS